MSAPSDLGPGKRTLIGIGSIPVFFLSAYMALTGDVRLGLLDGRRVGRGPLRSLDPDEIRFYGCMGVLISLILVAIVIFDLRTATAGQAPEDWE